MTSKKDRNKIPRDWEYVPVFSRRGYYRHNGIAMNRCQWLKPAIWTVATDEKRQSATVRCYWTYYVNNKDDAYSHVPATLTIVGDTLKVEKGPWEIYRRPGKTLFMAGIRWVEQQENAAKQYGSR